MAAMRAVRVGFVGTRFAGTDGVSLEAAKWARVLSEMGHAVYWFAGLLDRPAETSRCVPEAFFGHPDVAAVQAAVFHPPPEAGASDGRRATGRPEAISRRIDALTLHLEEALHAFVRDFQLDVLIPENALAIPMHLPLGLAITRLAAQTGLPILAHHHDLPWERQRFGADRAADIIAAAFPPVLPGVRHVCINSLQAEQIARRLGRTARVIPNVMDFADPPRPLPDELRRELRTDLGLAEEDLLVLQPTRVIPRKGIEHAVELVRRLERPARLVISHASGDEGLAYEEHIRELAHLLGVPLTWASDRVADARMVLPDGRRAWTLDDMYATADLVTYPSLVEGFGNAFLEAVQHRRPILVNRYAVYDVDIRPLGFRAIEMDGFLTGEIVSAVRALLDDPARMAEWGDHNHALASRAFSLEVARRGLAGELETILEGVAV